ncbi:class II aldolase/adducin family protein [Ramlibacter sp. AW1]|uniref:Class II aldolase/adducin family protein n=1 Tax=Ramlibacter aurantiacus TaxID=2801330 RepID=A0A936ZMK8_9BURK|nr:class II aldolase/adducin family protein [Ramlibacter aurantiacus]MBL0420063.1 class II aldolase/adducin family protein [Ramlibacter aurantiacus]
MTDHPLLDAESVARLVQANHILFAQGVVDGLGHVSVRHPSRPERFLLSCNRAPAMVRPEDIVCYDFDGNAVTPDAPRPYLERFIHAEIFRARPDVMSVVHSHSPNVIPFGATRQRLRPIFHMAGFLGEGTAHYDMRDAAGDTDLLVRNPELGRSLAEALGGCTCVLMRGHGSTTVGTSVEQAVYRAIYAEVNARLQSQAMGMGEVTYLTPREAQLAAEANDSQIQRSWDLWCRSVQKA